MSKNKVGYQFSSRLKYLLNQVYHEVPRLLSLMDDLKLSKTYGCFYPPYWREKQMNFVNARAQEAALTLAMLYSYDYPNNPYYGDEKLLDYAVAGMDYWTKLQHRNGSFDEWRRFEHGQACTAFLTVAMTDTFKLTKSFLSENLKNRVLQCFKKSGIFLCRNSDSTYLNHEAVAIAALYSCYELFRDKFYLKKIKEKITTLGREQSLEGGFMEGSGPDSGYNTVTLSYLAFYYKRSRDKTILPILKKAVNFSSYFLYPDGFTGGGFNSRQAGMLFPLGFIILSNELELARRLAQRSLDLLVDKMNDLLTLNDMRRCITLHKILRSYLAASGKELNTAVNLPAEKKGKFTKYMKQSGILVVKTPFYYLVIGTQKGCIGAIYSYTTDNTFHMSSPNGYDCLSGLLGLTHEGLLVSNIICPSVGTEVIIRKESMLTKLDLPLIDPETERRWMKDRLIDKPPLLHVYHTGSELGFRHAMLSIYERFHKERKRLRQKPILRLIREIGWTDNTITVLNDIVFLKPCDYKELYLGETFIVHEGLSEIRKCGTAVKYVWDGKKALIMSANGKNIEIKSGEPASLRFNKAQPMIARIHLNKKARELRFCYTLKLEPLHNACARISGG